MKHTDNNIIYEPTGMAKEYSNLACNIYKGCQHGCRYCFVKRRMSPEQKADCDMNPNPKEHFLEKLKHKADEEAEKMFEELFKSGYVDGPLPTHEEFQEQISKAYVWHKPKEILLSFLGDPYQPAEMELMLTRGALEILNNNHLPFTILTKGGTRACRDFDLFLEGTGGRFGTSIVWLDQSYADYWEPGAATIRDRIKAIQQAHDMGIPTWVSMEPVIEPDQALKVIRELHPIVDHWKVGKINHMPEIERKHDWLKFSKDVRGLLYDLDADYYLKDSLTKLGG